MHQAGIYLETFVNHKAALGSIGLNIVWIEKKRYTQTLST